MEISPFPFQGPLEPEWVAGRIDLQRDLRRRVDERRLTALLGPRRYGKTSILRRVASDLGTDGYETVWIDLYELSSMADLAGSLGAAGATVLAAALAAVDGAGLGVAASQAARSTTPARARPVSARGA